jgi:hypothetical protein
MAGAVPLRLRLRFPSEKFTHECFDRTMQKFDSEGYVGALWSEQCRNSPSDLSFPARSAALFNFSSSRYLGTPGYEQCSDLPSENPLHSSLPFRSRPRRAGDPSATMAYNVSV